MAFITCTKEQGEDASVRISNLRSHWVPVKPYLLHTCEGRQAATEYLLRKKLLRLLQFTLHRIRGLQAGRDTETGRVSANLGRHRRAAI